MKSLAQGLRRLARTFLSSGESAKEPRRPARANLTVEGLESRLLLDGKLGTLLAGPNRFGYSAYNVDYDATRVLSFSSSGNQIGASHNWTLELGYDSFNYFGNNFNEVTFNGAGQLIFGGSSTSSMRLGVLQNSWTGGLQSSKIDLNNDGKSDLLAVQWNVLGTGYSQVSFQAILQLNTGTKPGDITFQYIDLNTGNPYTSNGVGCSRSFTDGFDTLSVPFPAQGLAEKSAIRFTTTASTSPPVTPGAPGVYTDEDGDTYKVALAGPGTMEITQDDADEDGMGAIDTITLEGVDAKKSTLTITVTKKGGDGFVNVGAIDGSGGLKSLSAAKCNFVGTGISFDEYLAAVTVNDVTDGAQIAAAGTSSQKTQITAHLLDNATVDLGSAISTFKAAAFLSGELKAPSLGTLTISGDSKNGISGDFGASVSLSGDGIASGKSVLTTAAISGAVTDAVFLVQGNVGSFTAGAFVRSALLAGLDPADAFDSSSWAIDDFTSGVSITTFTVKGTFEGSMVAAAKMGTVSLATVETDNGATTFGVYGTQSIKKVTAKSPSFTYKATDSNPQSVGDFEVRKVS